MLSFFFFRFESPPLSPSPRTRFASQFRIRFVTLFFSFSYRRRHRPGLVHNRVPRHDVEEGAPRRGRGGGAEAAKTSIDNRRRAEADGIVVFRQSSRSLLGGRRARRREGQDREDAEEREEEASYPLH